MVPFILSESKGQCVGEGREGESRWSRAIPSRSTSCQSGTSRRSSTICAVGYPRGVAPAGDTPFGG
jgi:hypothetical protein